MRALLLLVVAAGCSKPAATFAVSSEWKPGCNAALNLIVTSTNASQVDVNGHVYPVRSALTILEMPASKPGDTIVVAGKPYVVPPKPAMIDGFGIDAAVANSVMPSVFHAQLGDVVIRELPNAHTSSRPNELQIFAPGCGLTPSTGSSDGAKFVVTPTQVEITYDLRARGVANKLDVNVDIAVTPAMHLKITGKLPAFDPVPDLIAHVAIAEAPDAYGAPPHEMITIVDGKSDGTDIMKASIAVIRETKSRDLESCGPYGNELMPTYAPREQIVETVKLYAIKTGKLIAQKTFAGAYPSCPESVMVTTTTYYGAALGNGTPDTITGDAPTKQVEAYLAAMRTSAKLPR